MDRPTLIVGASPEENADSFYRSLLGSAGLVIACDAAGEWCIARGRTPDIVVGDFDSAEPGAVGRLSAAGVDTRVHPAEKDESDLDLALAVARSEGAREVVFTAAFTRRLDHTLASLGTLVRASDLSPTIEEPSFSARLLDADDETRLSLAVTPGAIVSVVALRAASGVTLEGLSYPLSGAEVPLLSSLGVSNVATGSRVTVSVERGTLLVMASRS